MTNVFQPNVFQPNVFQVGTLDVVIPDAVTKRRKWLSISVPRSGRVSGTSAFAVSRDSAGILIGVRDNAAPQFGVSRDAGGIRLSAWPVASAVSCRNIIPNPEFFYNITDGWTAHSYETRDDAPPVALPNGCEAACKIEAVGEATTIWWNSTYYDIEPGVPAFWASAFLYRPSLYNTVFKISFWDDDYGWTSYDFYTGGGGNDAFVRNGMLVPAPPAAYMAMVQVVVYNCIPNDRPAWVTGFMLQPRSGGDPMADFADGRTSGWEWDGTPHNSASRGTT